MQNSTIELCRSLFKRATTGPAWTNPAANPMVVLCDITPSDLRHILHFMYNGEVEVKQANLNTFLAVAERLRVRGLCQSGGKTSPSPPSAPPGQTRSPPPHEVDRRRSASPSPQTSSSKQISTGQRRCSLGKVPLRLPIKVLCLQGLGGTSSQYFCRSCQWPRQEAETGGGGALLSL